jgi:hypothetical protein
MVRSFTFLVFIFLNLSLLSQDAIRITDPIPQQKAIIVIPGISTQQLQSLKTEFAKYSEIKQAVYVYQDHNCLLVNLEENGTLKFYSDLLKIIQTATGLTEQQVAIKTSAIYDKLMPANVITSVDPGEESNTNFVVK